MKKIIKFMIIILFVYLLISKSYLYTATISRDTPNDNIKELKLENNKLEKIFNYMFPSEDKAIYVDKFRNTDSFAETPIPKILNDGIEIPFDIIYYNPEYLRPIYDYKWRDLFFRNWLYLPQKISEARHKLFIFPQGASGNFDFTASLGFNEKVHIDFLNYANLLVYDFDVHNVKKIDNEILLIGKPSRNEVQVVAIHINDILSKDKSTDDFLFRLTTEGGYEIDYLYSSYGNPQYGKKEITKPDSISIPNKENNLEQLKEENKKLKEKLSKYIPMENKNLYADKCTNGDNNIPDLEYMLDKGESINLTFNYRSKDYNRPLYHPYWKKNYTKGVVFLPKKICENLYNIFKIPSDPKKQAKLFNSLAFFENYNDIGEDKIGFLVYNFNIEKGVVYDNNIIFLGTPSRTGAQMVSFSREMLTRSSYSISLSSPDFNEVGFIGIEF